MANRIELVTPPVTAKNPILSSHSLKKNQFYLVANRIELVAPLNTAKSVTQSAPYIAPPLYIVYIVHI